MLQPPLESLKERTNGTSPTPGGEAPDPADEPAVNDDSGGRRLVCAACGRRITSDGDRIAVDGKSQHTFVNPACVVFSITTYGAAPGCVAAGAPSSEWSWFAGHSWQIQLCSGCRAHLGWSFLGDGTVFWGLIDERLTEERDDHP